MAVTATQSRVIRQTATGKWLDGYGKMKPSIPIGQFMQAEPTDKVQVDAGFFGAVPFPVEFIGARQHKDLKSYTQTITPRKWELTIDFDVPTYDDDQTRTAAQTASKMLARCTEHMVRRWTQVIEAGTGTTLGTGYDGVAIYSGSHPESGTNQDNTHTSAAATGTQPTGTELLAVLDSDFQLADAYTDDQGAPLGGNPTDWTLMIPPAYGSVFATVLGSNGSAGGGQAIPGSDIITAQGSTVFRGMEYFVNPYMSNADRFYAFRKGGLPSVLVQRDPWDFQVKDRTNSDIGFEQDLITFGARARYEIGYGFWFDTFVHVFT